jgi:hypothetical protein
MLSTPGCSCSALFQQNHLFFESVRQVPQLSSACVSPGSFCCYGGYSDEPLVTHSPMLRADRPFVAMVPWFHSVEEARLPKEPA